MPALHVILGPQTATKLDEIAIVTEESKTAIVARLIREEWDREREKRSAQPILASAEPQRFIPPSVLAGFDPDLSTSPEDAVRRRRAAAFENQPGHAQLVEGGH